MYNVAVVLFKETSSGISSFFSMPKVEEVFEAGMGEENFRFHMLVCQYSSKNLLTQRKLRQLVKLCEENSINLLISINKPDAKLRLHETELADIGAPVREIKAIKLLGALIWISHKQDRNLLEKRIGFAASATDFETVDMLSEEASSITVLEDMDGESRDLLHMRVMQSRGVSVIFTKELSKLIKGSDVLIVDDGVDFGVCEELLKDKVLLGSNDCFKRTGGFSNVLLWPAPVEEGPAYSYIREYNNELLAVMKYCMKENDYMDFLSLLPYIYIFDGNGKQVIMP